MICYSYNNYHLPYSGSLKFSFTYPFNHIQVNSEFREQFMKKEHFKLCLYVAGDNRKSSDAIDNLRKYCEEHLRDAYTIEVIDLVKHPHLAAGDQIIATPTLIKELPAPVRVLVGDLSQEHKFLVGMNLVPLFESEQ